MIERETRDGVTVLRLAHGKANALDLELCTAVEEALDGLGTGPVVLTGTGRIFSAGVDLFRIVGGGAEYVEVFVPRLEEMCHRLFTFPRPLVAAVNGHAVAGGCIIASAADRRIMVRGRGRIGVPELRVGVPFPSIALEVLRAAVGDERSRGLVLGGDTHEPEEALGLGLVDEVVDEDELLDRSVEEALRLATIPAETFALTKRQLRQPALDRVAAAEALDAEIRTVWATETTRMTIERYLASTLERRRS